MKPLQLIECPRDAMQGWDHFIPTESKIAYETALLKAGFHTLDFGSFVNPKAIPQMADTQEVLNALPSSNTRLLAIVGNLRGAEMAAASPKIQYIGFPFSLSETFQQRNTNAGREEAFDRVKQIQELCVRTNKEQVVYLSMGFGNPYGDPFSAELVAEWAARMVATGIQVISLSDTVGVATPEEVANITSNIIRSFPDSTIGVHLHATPDSWKEKISAALDAGCLRFDGAIMGFGGCPLSGNALVGNIPMEQLVLFLEEKGIDTGISQQALEECVRLAQRIFL
ncbi:MAG: hydroxymethylglutaryl-CoA lyase [Chitinophagaceae bacterium]